MSSFYSPFFASIALHVAESLAASCNRVMSQLLMENQSPLFLHVPGMFRSPLRTEGLRLLTWPQHAVGKLRESLTKTIFMLLQIPTCIPPPHSLPTRGPPKFVPNLLTISVTSREGQNRSMLLSRQSKFLFYLFKPIDKFRFHSVCCSFGTGCRGVDVGAAASTLPVALSCTP